MGVALAVVAKWRFIAFSTWQSFISPLLHK